MGIIMGKADRTVDRLKCLHMLKLCAALSTSMICGERGLSCRWVSPAVCKKYGIVESEEEAFASAGGSKAGAKGAKSGACTTSLLHLPENV